MFNNNVPLISCICLTRKRPVWLVKAIACFQAQTYANKELVVVGHEDDFESAAVVKQFGHLNLKYVMAPTLSNAALKNLAIEKCSGEYFCFWDDDDWQHNRRLEVQYNQMEENGKQASLLVNRLLYDMVNEQAFLSYPMMNGKSILCNKNLFYLGIKYDANKKNADVDFIARLQELNCIYPVMMPSLYIYVYHGANATSEHDFKTLFQRSQRLSASATRLIKAAVNGAISVQESSRQLSDPDFLGEFDYLRNSGLAIDTDDPHAALVKRLTGKEVMNGPFKGLKYPSLEAAGSTIIPKLVGSYEHELEPVINEIIGNRYSDIVNIGCGEGYYVNGLALANDRCKVFAYDTDPEARKICAEMARLNGVSERVHIGDFFTPEMMSEFQFSGKALIICDCEGFEMQLFNKENRRNLFNCDLLIETHDFIDINISTAVADLLKDTHQITVIESLDDNLKAKRYSFPPFCDITDLHAKKYLYKEERPCIMEWLWCKSGRQA